MTIKNTKYPDRVISNDDIRLQLKKNENPNADPGDNLVDISK
jgi:hypothetical protein